MGKFKDQAIDAANVAKEAPKKIDVVDAIDGVAVLSSRKTEDGLIVVLEDGRKLLVGGDGKAKDV
jgi:hypothetical protein